jgi:DNA-binding MarR family transcriptional regulator
VAKKTRESTVLESTLHLLHRASQLADESFALKIGREDLTARQFIVLSIVANTENPSQTMICDQSGIDRSTLADIVRRLVARGLLSRRRTRQDARMYAVKITDAGNAALDKARPVARAVDQELLGVLTASQRNDFETTLRLMISKLHDAELV